VSDYEQPAMTDDMPPLPDEVTAESEEALPVTEKVEVQREFEDLTLAEALDLFVRKPRSTFAAFVRVAQQPTDTPNALLESIPVTMPVRAARSEAEAPSVVPDTSAEVRGSESTLLIGRLIAFALAVWGGVQMFSSQLFVEEQGLNVGAPFLLAGFGVWLFVEIVNLRLPINGRPTAAPQAHEQQLIMPALAWRLFLGIGAALTGVLAWAFNGGNQFTMTGVLAWIACIVLTIWTVAPYGWTPLTPVTSLINTLRRLRVTWVLVALILITALGAYFRFAELRTTPPEMTSDHVEKLLDANRVVQGDRDVFFAGNHGRDAIQFYLLAFSSTTFGVPLDFTLLKTLTAIEGVITLPVMYWMGREIIGRENRKLGDLVGLLTAALVAVSYWHLVLSSLGLRIVLTPLFVGLIIIFLVRALRYNRREDFIAAGLTLGIGLYAYQAIRMVPVVIVVGVVIAFLFKARGLIVRREMIFNFIVLVLVSFTVFIPLFRYSTDYPEDFWRRTSGRLFGDDLTQQMDEDGNLRMRVPSLQERIDAFNQNIPALLSNYRNAALMYNWKGDIAWFQNAPLQPAMDIITGGLLIIGVAAWIARMIKRRDPADWIILPMIVIMMLPSALSIAYPLENPSSTRMSGTLPGVYLLAAFPLALIVQNVTRMAGRLGTAVAAVAVAGLLLFAYSANRDTLQNGYRALYLLNSLPHREAGEILRGFVEQGGSYGNAFILASDYWWDHRAVGIEGGRIDYPNSITSLGEVPKWLRDGRLRADAYQLDPSRDLLFFYHPDNVDAEAWLTETFPDGSWRLYETSIPNKDFKVFIVPALGAQGFNDFLRQNELDPTEPTG